MSDTCEAADLLAYFPPEILQMIFIYLPAKSLTRCRAVCQTWKTVVDDLSKNECMWRRNCKDNFANVYQLARRRAKPGLPWFCLYRSLSLWRLLMNAAEEHKQFVAASSSPLTEIRSFKILNDGMIGILQEGSVAYYDIETLALSERPPLLGDFAKYTENDHFVVILSSTLHLHIMRKEHKHKMIDVPALTYNDVKQFALVGQELFFVSFQDEIYVCDLRLRKLHANFMARLSDRIMSIGYSDGYFNVLTFQRYILAFVKGSFVKRATLSLYSNLVQQLQTYQLLNQMDWRMYFQWMDETNREIHDRPLRDVKMVKHYGDIYFVGFYWGVLRIYCTKGNLDLLKCKPIKQFNFMKPEEKTAHAHSMCPILQVDVVEMNDGHTVFVAMPKRIVVLNFTHNFLTETSRMYTHAMLPNISEVPDVEELDLDAPGPSHLNE